MSFEFDCFDNNEAADRIEIDQIALEGDTSWGWIAGVILFVIGLILLIC